MREEERPKVLEGGRRIKNGEERKEKEESGGWPLSQLPFVSPIGQTAKSSVWFDEVRF